MQVRFRFQSLHICVKTWFTVASLLFGFFQYGNSQEHSLAFDKIQTSDGLSQSSVMDITQDQQGLVWIATRDGLNRFDGHGFKVYYHRPGDSTSLSSSDIFDLKVDSGGDIWIGTKNGLNRLNMASLSIQRFDENRFPQRISRNTVLTIEERSKGEIWVGTTSGLSVLSKGDEEDLITSGKLPLLEDFVEKQIRKIYCQSDGNIWLGTTDGIYRVSFTSNNEIEDVERFLISNDQEAYYVQSIVEDQNGVLWIGTRSHGIFYLDSASRYFRSFVPANKTEINANIRDLLVGKDGLLWVATYEGLVKIVGNKAYTYFHDPRIPTSLSKNTVKTVFEDAGGTVWVGTYYGGINLWNAVNKNFINYEKDIDGAGLGYEVVSSIVEDETSVFFGTEGGGVSIMNKKDGQFSYITRDRFNIISDNVKSLRLDKEKQLLWIGTLNTGLLAFDLVTKEFVRSLTQESGLLSNSVYCFDSSGDGVFYIGNFGAGLTIFNSATDEFKYLVNDPDDKSSLLDNQVRAVLVDNQGNLWVGTQGGLSSISVTNIRSGSYQFDHFDSSDGGVSLDILAIYQDRKSKVWIGTRENGLYYIEKGKLVSVDLVGSEENASNTIQAIVEDDSGNIWLSTNAGIISFNPQIGQKKYLKVSDGLISNEYNQNAVLRSESGLLYFGGPEGVTSFDPRSIITNDYVPKVVITGLSIYNEAVIPGDETGILSDNISLKNKLELDHDQSNFTLTFALPNYINSEKNSYEYRLTGLDQKWKKSGLNQADFTIQESGKYVFEVRGINSDGITTQEATKLELRVHPAPWRTWWAFVIYGFILMLTLLAFIRITQSRSALKLDLMAEHQRNEQQEELNKMKLQFFTNISHEFRTPLTLVLGSLEQVMREYSGGNRVYKQLQVMQHSAGQLLKLINQLMDFRKIENKQAKLQAGEGNIVKFVNEIFLSFKGMAKAGEYTFSFQSNEPEIIAYYDRDKLERVFYNLLSNAFKFTPKGGKITVSVYRENQFVTIDVIDSGRGVIAEDKEQIFTRFFQSKADFKLNETTKGTGIGLALSKGIIDLHKGSLALSDGYGTGSKFSVSLLLGAEHLDESEIIHQFKDSEHPANYEVITPQSVPSIKVNTDRLVMRDGLRTILVVEDNSQVRNLIVGLLLQNYNVIEAENGKEGLDIAIEKVPDLIISDVMMPEMDGIELCGRIKNHLKTSHIPVVLLTARTSLIFKYDGLESGADDYINKPFNFRELELKVANLISLIDKLRKKFASSTNLTPSEIATSSKDEELLTQAIAIVDENIANEFFDVSLFCKELGVSRTMLFTKVKAWTDLTPNDFIQTMRMKRACQLLEEGKSTVSQICFAVGYKSPKYFSKVFQKHYGMNPSEYAAKFNAKLID